MCKKRGTNCDRRRKWKWQINTFEPFGGILPATKRSRDAVVEACRKSGALGFIEKLDHGFGQKIGQDGAKLSGGERQKIAVARALLKNADILLMDEATEGFDVESNEALRELLHSELKNKTIVFITHKYKELESVDKVYRLSKGILELVRS